ncbi:LysM peptidoglycan-binding domain-containing protein [Lysobacter fragariae]
MNNHALNCALALLLAAPACAQAAPPADSSPGHSPESVLTPAGTRNGREIYQRFRDGLADKTCNVEDTSARWRAHFAHAPRQMAARNDDVLPLFGYVVDALRDAQLPTEYALIPFVESGYKPGARSAQGPAGLWQMIAITARNHKVPIRAGYDGRLSPVDSTAAAVHYLKTLHRMFGGDWRLAVMGYNAGEYRVLGAIKRSGQSVRTARPETLPGLSPITQAYVRKLHALSCLMEKADDRAEWLRAIDRPVPRLRAVTVPDGISDIAAWARRSGQDAAQLQRLNPVFANGRLARVDGNPARLLAVSPEDAAEAAAMGGDEPTVALVGDGAASGGVDAADTGSASTTAIAATTASAATNAAVAGSDADGTTPTTAGGTTSVGAGSTGSVSTSADASEIVATIPVAAVARADDAHAVDIAAPDDLGAGSVGQARAAAADASREARLPEPRRHTVARGDNPWKIARRYGVGVDDLLQRNGLSADSTLRPGRVLLIDAQEVVAAGH